MAAESVEETPRQFITRVREQTCYKSLRSVLVVCAVVGYIIGVFFLVYALAELFQGADAEPAVRVFGPFYSVGSATLAGLLTIVLTQASYQASILLVDISDTLIEQARLKD